MALKWSIFPYADAASDWFDSSQNAGSMFDLDFFQVSVPSSLDTPTSLANGSSTATFSFTPTAPTDGARLLLTVVSALSGGGPLPSSISGLGVTWTLVGSDVTGNGVVRLAHYTAKAGSGSGAVTVTFGTTPGWWAWNLAQFTQSDGGTPTVRQSAFLVDLLTSSGATLASAPYVTSLLFGAVGYNAGSGQSLTAGGGFTPFATRQSNSSPAASMLTEYDNALPISQSSSFTSGNGSGKIYSAVEIGLGTPPVVGTPQIYVYNGSTEVLQTIYVYNGSTEVALTIEIV